MYIINYRRRAQAAFLLFGLLFLLCFLRLFFIQLFHSEYLAELAQKQHNFFIELEPRRGTIFDVNLKPLAVNLPVDSIYACPDEIKTIDKDSIAQNLSKILRLKYSFIKGRLDKKKKFVWLARKVDYLQAEEIKKLNIKGIGFLKESKRSYPNSYILSQVLGFAGIDNNGLEGIELFYDKFLKGQPGWTLPFRDARGKKLELDNAKVLPKDGYDLVLTIDEVIQYIAERELDKVFHLFRAKGASIVVMNPKTGEILALASRPNFDLNDPKKHNKDQIRNRPVCDMFEPGSVYKIVTASAALEEQKVTEMDKFYCENGAYKYGNRILHDHKAHGTLTFKEVIEQSSNIGTCKVAQLLGPELLYKYEKLFGFGLKTGIDLPGEISGIVKPPRVWSKTSITAVPMGQEVGVTSLQLAQAISAIANGGVLMKPYIIKEIKDKTGEVINSFKPVEVNRVMSEDTAARMRKILIGVIENGTGTLGKIPGFTAGGKTGTAQKVEANGTYSHSKFTASFIGFAPGEDPLISIVVNVDEPRGYYFGGVVSGPVFKNVASEVLRYLKTKEYNNDVGSSYEN